MNLQVHLARRPLTASRAWHGFILLGLLILLALAGWALAAYSQSAAAARQRDVELDLLWVGQQYRAAIESYYRSTPGPIKQLPTRLEDLLQDPRYPAPLRHLRRLYADPMAPDEPWGLIRLNGQIIGLYSQARGEPFRRVDFDTSLESFTGALSYADWRFIWVPPRQPGGANNALPPGPAASGITNPTNLR